MGDRGADLFEGELSRQLGPQHDHPGHPEEEDVAARLQHRVREELVHVGGLGEVNNRTRP